MDELERARQFCKKQGLSYRLKTTSPNPWRYQGKPTKEWFGLKVMKNSGKIVEIPLGSSPGI